MLLFGCFFAFRPRVFQPLVETQKSIQKARNFLEFYVHTKVLLVELMVWNTFREFSFFTKFQLGNTLHVMRLTRTGCIEKEKRCTWGKKRWSTIICTSSHALFFIISKSAFTCTVNFRFNLLCNASITFQVLQTDKERESSLLKPKEKT